MIPETPCLMNIRYFPLDKQSCHLEFGLWASTDAMIRLHVRIDKVVKENYVPNTQWEVTSSQVKAVTKTFLGVDDTFTNIIATINIKRKPLFYVVNLIVPCILVSFLTVLAFCLPITSPDKINLSISLLLTIYIFNLLVADLLPVTSIHMPLLTVYLIFIMVLISISIALTVLFTRVYVKCTEHSSPVPKWAKSLFLELLAKVLMVRGCSTSKCDDDKSNIAPADSEFQPICGFDKITTESTVALGKRVATNRQNTNTGVHCSMPRRYVRGYKCSFRVRVIGKKQRCSFPINQREKYYGSILEKMDTLIFYVKNVSDVVSSPKKAFDEQIRYEWKTLAKVVDRMSLMVFTFITIIGSIIILPRIM
ncbi:acetylcholine receptor non-alpha chain-like [Ptychodera flava]|uniref:acetylcholine receptor non-alpha chain-like n=1 Tax=Ptychodera flava TaxID=63121 RepID=UPI003969F72D